MVARVRWLWFVGMWLSAELVEGTRVGMFVYMYKHTSQVDAACCHTPPARRYTTHFEIMLHLRNKEILLDSHFGTGLYFIMFNKHIFTLKFLYFKILDLQNNLVNLMKDVKQTATHQTLTLTIFKILHYNYKRTLR